MQAAIGISQLEKVDSFIQKRKENFSYLYEKFKEFEMFDLPLWNELSEPSWFGFPLSLNSKAKFKREDLLRFYEERKIGTRLLFAGNITKQPAYLNVDIKSEESLPVADYVMENTFWLGVYPGLSENMLEFIFNETKNFVKDNS